MPDFVTYNSTTKRILEYFRSVDTNYLNRLSLTTPTLEVTRETLDAVERSRFYLVENNRVRPMTQLEIDALLAEERAATVAEENALLAQIDDDIFALADFPMAKTDLLIDGIKDLEGAKLFLKRLVKYVAKNTGN